MTVSIDVKRGARPTAEQIEEIRLAALRKPCYDEDAPELTTEQLKRYRKAAVKKKETKPVTINLSEDEIKRAKGFAENYREFLGKLLSLAMRDEEMIGRARGSLSY